MSLPVSCLVTQFIHTCMISIVLSLPGAPLPQSSRSQYILKAARTKYIGSAEVPGRKPVPLVGGMDRGYRHASVKKCNSEELHEFTSAEKVDNSIRMRQGDVFLEYFDLLSSCVFVRTKFRGVSGGENGLESRAKTLHHIFMTHSQHAFNSLKLGDTPRDVPVSFDSIFSKKSQ